MTTLIMKISSSKVLHEPPPFNLAIHILQTAIVFMIANIILENSSEGWEAQYMT